jgi:hypothetical protein
MSFSRNNIALFIDGANLYATGKTLGFDSSRINPQSFYQA